MDIYNSDLYPLNELDGASLEDLLRGTYKAKKDEPSTPSTDKSDTTRIPGIILANIAAHTSSDEGSDGAIGTEGLLHWLSKVMQMIIYNSFTKTLSQKHGSKNMQAELDKKKEMSLNMTAAATARSFRKLGWKSREEVRQLLSHRPYMRDVNKFDTATVIASPGVGHTMMTLSDVEANEHLATYHPLLVLQSLTQYPSQDVINLLMFNTAFITSDIDFVKGIASLFKCSFETRWQTLSSAMEALAMLSDVLTQDDFLCSNELQSRLLFYIILRHYCTPCMFGGCGNRVLYPPGVDVIRRSSTTAPNTFTYPMMPDGVLRNPPGQHKCANCVGEPLEVFAGRDIAAFEMLLLPDLAMMLIPPADAAATPFGTASILEPLSQDSVDAAIIASILCKAEDSDGNDDAVEDADGYARRRERAIKLVCEPDSGMPLTAKEVADLCRSLLDIKMGDMSIRLLRLPVCMRAQVITVLSRADSMRMRFLRKTFPDIPAASSTGLTMVFLAFTTLALADQDEAATPNSPAIVCLRTEAHSRLPTLLEGLPASTGMLLDTMRHLQASRSRDYVDPDGVLLDRLNRCLQERLGCAPTEFLRRCGSTWVV